jgi:hypothetical protein
MNWNDGSESHNVISRLRGEKKASTRAFQIAVLEILDGALRELAAGRMPGGDWSVQGFGMLRLYIKKIGRLHVWDTALRYPAVSMIHNHSWDLRSHVVSGVVQNTRYLVFENEEGARKYWGEKASIFKLEPFYKHTMITGYNCEVVVPQSTVFLHGYRPELFRAGEHYTQAASEIHRTDASDGTITLMERNEDVNGQADIFWPEGEEWGTARPRRATRDDLFPTLTLAAGKLESEIQS